LSDIMCKDDCHILIQPLSDIMCKDDCHILVCKTNYACFRIVSGSQEQRDVTIAITFKNLPGPVSSTDFPSECLLTRC